MTSKKYKFITVEDTIAQSEGKVVYVVTNNKTPDTLGYLKWNRRWREWIFKPEDFTSWSVSCLRDIIDFMENHAGKAEVGR